MKYTTSIEIDLPRSKVVELFNDPENLKKWQPGFVSLEHISGEPGTTGAKSRLKYKMGKREIEMIETITKMDLPNAFDFTYEAKGVFNIIENRFEELGENRSRWTSENEFQLKGAMKLMGWLMPGAFKKQSLKYMKDFKAFAEGESN